MKNIAIAYATKDDEYVYYLCVSMFSCAANTKQKIDFYVLHPSEFSENSKKLIQSIALKSGSNVFFVDVKDAFQNVKLTHDFISYPTYYRLLIPKLLPKTVEKCIYLDTDAIAVDDIFKLFSIDVKNYYLAGVVAAGYLFSKEENELRLNLPDVSGYTNAGVLLMNVTKMRKENLEQKFMSLLEKKYHDQDQDILNVACFGKIMKLPLKYNLMTKYNKIWDSCVKCGAYSHQEIEEALKHPLIIHFADKIKPWNDDSIVFSNLWWKIAKKMSFYKKLKAKLVQKNDTRKKNNNHKKYNNLLILLKMLLKKKRTDKFPCDSVHAISYANFVPMGGAGGPHAALTMMKQVLTDYPIKYSFKTASKYSVIPSFWAIIWGGAKAAFQISKKEKNTFYITHEIGSAFGLWLAGKKYVLGFHAQGSFVEEQINWGNKLSFCDKKILSFVEKCAFKHAQTVFFPSSGAYDYFIHSPYNKLKKKDFNYYGAIYNTLWFSSPSEKFDVGSNADITFLSIGQLTLAKGIDQCLEFFNHICKKAVNKKIKYIIVGDGVLKEKIIKNLEKLKRLNSNFDFLYIAHGISNERLAYLKDISDVYIMFHRISVFDLGTLEMMQKGKAVVLSDVGGNPEFNKENNIILWHDENDNENVASLILDSNLIELGKKNKHVYETYFCHIPYKEAYKNLLKQFIPLERIELPYKTNGYNDK